MNTYRFTEEIQGEPTGTIAEVEAESLEHAIDDVSGMSMTDDHGHRIQPVINWERNTVSFEEVTYCYQPEAFHLLSGPRVRAWIREVFADAKQEAFRAAVLAQPGIVAWLEQEGGPLVSPQVAHPVQLVPIDPSDAEAQAAIASMVADWESDFDPASSMSMALLTRRTSAPTDPRPQRLRVQGLSGVRRINP